MITNDQLRVAAELAITLVEDGATWPQLRRAQTDKVMRAAIVAAVQSPSKHKRPHAKMAAAHMPLRTILPDTMQGGRIHKILRSAGIWYIEDLTICRRDQVAVLLRRVGAGISAVEDLMRHYGVSFCPDGIRPQERAIQTYGSVDETPLRMVLFTSRDLA